MATPLPGPLSDTDSCLIFQRLSLAVTCNGLIEVSSRNASVLRFVIRAYRLAWFTAIGCVSETRLLRFGRHHRQNQSRYHFARDRPTRHHSGWMTACIMSIVLRCGRSYATPAGRTPRISPLRHRHGSMSSGLSRALLDFSKKLQKLSVYLFCVCPSDTVRPILHHQQAGSLDELGSPKTRGCDR